MAGHQNTAGDTLVASSPEEAEELGDDSEITFIAAPAATKKQNVEVPKVVLEYPLPAAKQTHEIVAVGKDLLLLSQQSNDGLVKVALDPATGRPCASVRFTVGGSHFAGLHGLFASKAYPGNVWATLQFESAVIRLDPVAQALRSPPVVVDRIPLPVGVLGPHAVVEKGDNLWISCKDSRHVVRVNYRKPNNNSMYECSPRPILVAIHPKSGDVYASLDQSSKIFRLFRPAPIDTDIPAALGGRIPVGMGAVRQSQSIEIDIPAANGSTPVGIIEGPDGNVWFVLLGDSSGGTGTFGRISEDGEITWFRLTSKAGAQAGLIHLAFDQQHSKAGRGLRLWLLGSSMASDSCTNAIFTVCLEGEPLRIVSEDTIILATPCCMTHRILPHRGGLFVTELAVSILAHVTGAALGTEDLQSKVASETSDAYSFWGLGRSTHHVNYLEPRPRHKLQQT